MHARLSPLPRWAHRALAALALVALLPTAACTAEQAETAPEPAAATPTPVTSAMGLAHRLRFEAVGPIFEDSRGHFWFGSRTEGLARFDGTALTYFTVDDGLSHNQIRAIREDARGVVWFEGGTGLTGYDGEAFFAPAERDYASKDAWQAQDGDVWFKSDAEQRVNEFETEPGVYRYDGDTFTYLAYPVPEGGDPNAEYATTGIARGQDGRLWFATYDAVFGYDGRAFTVLDNASLGLDESAGRLHVRSVFEDSRGRLWIGNNGIGVLLREGDTVTRFTEEHGLGGPPEAIRPEEETVGPPSLHRVFAIGEDRAGHIWFGTIAHGAWRYDGTSLRHYSAADGLTSADVTGIYTDRDGDLWVAGQGVFRFNGTSFDRMF